MPESSSKTSRKAVHQFGLRWTHGMICLGRQAAEDALNWRINLAFLTARGPADWARTRRLSCRSPRGPSSKRQSAVSRRDKPRLASGSRAEETKCMRMGALHVDQRNVLCSLHTHGRQLHTTGFATLLYNLIRVCQAVCQSASFSSWSLPGRLYQAKSTTTPKNS